METARDADLDGDQKRRNPKAAKARAAVASSFTSPALLTNER
jgi:hypothetical protein